MDKDSLKAILAHECAHAKGEDVRYRMFNVLPRLLMVWIVLLKEFNLGVLLLIRPVVVGSAFVSLFVYIILKSLLRCWGGLRINTHRSKRRFADIQKFAHASVEGSINAFLRLNDRSHTLELLERVLKQRFESIDQYARGGKILPNWCKDFDHLTEMITSYVTAKVTSLCRGLQAHRTRGSRFGAKT